MTTLLPEECPPLGAAIGWALKDAPPQVGQAMIGGVLGNMVGHIPDDHWEKMKLECGKHCECGRPNCDHINQRLFKLLDELREEWKRVVGEEPPTLEQKGFSE